MLDRAFTEHKLSNGKGTGYGYGWFTGNIQGSKVVVHAGGGCFCGRFLQFQGKITRITSAGMAAMVIGKPFQMKEVQLSTAELLPYTGVYETVDGGGIGYVTLHKGALYYQSKGGNKFRMVPCGQDAFIFDNTVSTVFI